MIKNLKYFLVSLLLLLTITPSKPWAFTDIEGQNILMHVDQTMFPESFRSFYVVENATPDGRKLAISLFSAQNKSGQSVVLIVDPPALRGRSAFWDGKIVWTHIPGEVEPRKNELQQSIVGGVFNNMDLLTGPFHHFHKAHIEKEDKDHHYLKLIPVTETLPYAYMDMKIDKSVMLPVELIQYAKEGQVFKRIHFEDVKVVTKNWQRPTKMKTFSEINPRYQSEWRLGTMDDKKIPPEAFTVEFLPNLGNVLK